MLSATSSTRVPSKYGRANEYITVDGYHTFTIRNTIHQRQTYEIYVSLDCAHMSSYYRRYVDVEPDGYYTRDDHTYGAVQESSPGNFRIMGYSKVSGESSDSSQDSATLSISR